MSIKIDKNAVPNMPLITKLFPFFIKAKINNGIFKARILIPIGSFKK